MADIHPLRGIHYDLSVVCILTRLICPPDHVMTQQPLQELHARDEHNFVRLEFGRELPQDAVGDNRYSRSAAALEQWLSQGILETDRTPAIYVHDHYFHHQGREHRRRGMIVRVRLEEWETMVVRPHEGTLAGARRDRLDLLWALQANTSPVMVMYQDPGREISCLIDGETDEAPVMQTRDLDGERHDIWAITEPRPISQIASLLADQALYIADGHHRYTSALTYRRERRAISPESSENEPFDFVMMTLVDIDDPGLVILAPHRLIRGISRPLLDGLLAKLEVFFETERLPLDTPDLWCRVDELLADGDGARLACFGPVGDDILLLHLRDSAEVSSMMPSFHSPLFQRQDVCIVDHLILEKLLEIDADGDETKVHYGHDRQEAVGRVRDGEYQLTFFLNPVRPQLVKAIADEGETMPRKSTYFYPKTPVGLVFNRLV